MALYESLGPKIDLIESRQKIIDISTPLSRHAEPTVQKAANSLLHLLTEGKIDIKNGTNELPDNTVTHFKLVRSGLRDTYPVFRPTILINPDAILSKHSEELAPDVMRTAGITMQFPDHGYDDRFKDIYKRAYDIQNELLKNTGSSATYDPRKTNSQTLAFNLMDEKEMFADTGISDVYQSVMSLIEGHTPIPHTREEIIRAVNSGTNFVYQRAFIHSMLTPDVIQRFKSISPKQRMQSMSEMMLSVLLPKMKFEAS